MDLLENWIPWIPWLQPPQTDADRSIQAQKAWTAYHGQAKRQLKVKRGQVDPNVRANYARVIVDKGVTMLFGKEIALDIVQDELTKDTPALDKAQAFLDETWRHNRKMALLQKAAMNAALLGEAFLQLVPATETEPIKIVNLNPANTYTLQDPLDTEHTTQYAYCWSTQSPDDSAIEHAVTWTENDILNNWTIAHLQRPNGGSWRLTAEPYTWDYPFPPIVHWQNLPLPSSYCGTPDISDDVLHLCERLNLVLSTWNKTIIHHAYPKTYGTGFDAEEMQTSPDGVTVIPSKDAKLDNLEMQNSANANDLLFTRLKEALLELARIPEVATGKMQNIGSLSGLALNILYGPMLECAQQKRLLVGPELEELSQRILLLGNFKRLTVSAEWPELLPNDPDLEAKVLTQDKAMGIASNETISRKRGYNPVKEAARIKREGTTQTNG